MSRSKIVFLLIYLIGAYAASQAAAHLQYPIDDELVLEAELIPNLVTTSSKRLAARIPVAPEPLDAMRITSNFGLRKHPILHRFIEHDGVDLAAKLNDPVRTVSDGTVTSAGWRGGYGNAVEIYHSKLKRSTIYAHLNKIKVADGQRVRQGQIIGLAGTTGLSTGVHLHFGVQNNAGGYVNPMQFLASLAGEAGSFVAGTANAAEVQRPLPVRKTRSYSRVAVAKAVAKKIVRKRAPAAQSPVMVARKAPAVKHKSTTAAAAPVVAKRDKGDLQDRFAKAAKEAEEYSMLYDEGAISRVERDQKLATAKKLEAALSTP